MRRRALWRQGFLPVAAAALLAVCAGCEEDGYRDHKPPAGSGSLVVDNNTRFDFELFVNGSLAGPVDDRSERVVDLAPGVYRIVLAEDDNGASVADYIDILQGRLTIVHVEADASRFGGFSTWVEIEE